jgi:hypothetical protein
VEGGYVGDDEIAMVSARDFELIIVRGLHCLTEVLLLEDKVWRGRDAFFSASRGFENFVSPTSQSDLPSCHELRFLTSVVLSLCAIASPFLMSIQGVTDHTGTKPA